MSPADHHPPPPPPPKGKEVRFSFKLLGAELLWYAVPVAQGITLRDLLAVQAMNGLMLNVGDQSGGPLFSQVARRAYRMADAMLEARRAAAAPPSKADPLQDDTDQRLGID